MKKRRTWVVWLIVVGLFAIGGTILWIKMVVDEQPEVHEDPGIPEVEVPDPEMVE